MTRDPKCTVGCVLTKRIHVAATTQVKKQTILKPLSCPLPAPPFPPPQPLPSLIPTLSLPSSPLLPFPPPQR